MLGDSLKELELTNNGEATLELSAVVEEDGFRKFTVIADGVNLVQHGVAVGDAVEYRLASGGTVNGTIERVDYGQCTVRYRADSSLDPDMDDPWLRIRSSGSLSRQFRAMLGDLTDYDALRFEAPTIQDLVYRLADLLGVDVEDLPVRFVGGAQPAPGADLGYRPGSNRCEQGIRSRAVDSGSEWVD